MKPLSLKEIFSKHDGKVSDKWGSYLDLYEEILNRYRKKQVNLLEIGIQNGGSLEIWSKYFESGRLFVGCDINPECKKLIYQDTRCHIVIGDACQESAYNQITKLAYNYDIIIDDGSHLSNDIINGFLKYFPKLANNGVYIIEDLHCSYWKEYGGGLYSPASAIAFVKALADIVNYEAWGLTLNRQDYLSVVASDAAETIHENILAEIHGVSFYNSVCVIQKTPAGINSIGVRHITGNDERITRDVRKTRLSLSCPNQTKINGRVASILIKKLSQLKNLVWKAR